MLYKFLIPFTDLCNSMLYPFSGYRWPIFAIPFHIHAGDTDYRSWDCKPIYMYILYIHFGDTGYSFLFGGTQVTCNSILHPFWGCGGARPFSSICGVSWTPALCPSHQAGRSAKSVASCSLFDLCRCHGEEGAQKGHQNKGCSGAAGTSISAQPQDFPTQVHEGSTACLGSGGTQISQSPYGDLVG